MKQSPISSIAACLLVFLGSDTALTQSALKFNRVQTINPGQLQLEIHGPTNRTVIVEASTNFVDWRFVWDAVPGSIPPDGIVTPVVDLGEVAREQYLRALYLGATENPDPVTELAGDGGANANSVLPELGMPPIQEWETGAADGVLPLALPHVIGIFSDTTTVQQVNDLLLQQGLRIIGSLPEINVVLLQDDSITTVEGLENRIAQLQSTGLFDELAPNIGMDLPIEEDDPVPAVNTVGPPTSQSVWSWDVSPLGQGTGGNNAFELSRIPQMWNWLDHGSRQKKRYGGHRLALMEYSFYAGHEDLPANATLRSGNGVTASKRRHGTAVAGVVSARRNNEEGVQGVNPLLAQLEGVGIQANATNSWSTAHLASISGLLKRRGSQRALVINMSFGVPWGTNRPTAGNMTSVDRLGSLWCAALGTINTNFGSKYLVFCSAGNDGGVDARYNSPMANIACRTNLSGRVPNFMTVESVDGTGATSSFSNIDVITAGDLRGQSISAGGDSITVLAGPASSAYRPSASGTSYASPFASAVASFLWTLEPTLTVSNVKFLLSHADTTRAVAGGANLIDGFAAALRIDELENGDPLQKALVDVDDGTLDGNLRKPGMPFEKSPDDIHTYDQRRGDGRVTMSDFRAFRDAYLHSIGITDQLDGPATHYKRDLNFDGIIDGQVVAPAHPIDTFTPSITSGAPDENVFARYDFNGNGRIDPGNLLVAPGAQDVSPFKVDPETNCSGRDVEGGCLLDIDVMLNPDFWEVTDENVRASGGDFFGLVPGIEPPPTDWHPLNIRMTNLFGGVLPISYLPFLWSCDLHISVEETDPTAFIGVPVGGLLAQADGLWVQSAGLFGNARGGEWEGVMTLPVYHPVHHPTGPLPPEGQGVTIQYKKTVEQEWRQYRLIMNPTPGEDVLLELGFNKLDLNSTTRSRDPAFVPRTTQVEVLAKVPGAAPFTSQIIPDSELGRANEIADQMAVATLSARLKLPALLGAGAEINGIYETHRIDDNTLRLDLIGAIARYQ